MGDARRVSERPAFYALSPGGARDYSVTPRKYQIVGYNNSVIDFSDVNFPVWPNLNIGMPKDLGWSTISTTDPDGTGPLLSAQARENRVLQGVTACAKCHGDPDGAGTVTPPAQGSFYEEHPRRQTCGSCHDDIDWTKPYRSNGQTMPAQHEDGVRGHRQVGVVDPEKLGANHLSLEQVSEALRATNQVPSVGRLPKDYLQYLVVGNVSGTSGVGVCHAGTGGARRERPCRRGAVRLRVDALSRRRADRLRAEGLGRVGPDGPGGCGGGAVGARRGPEGRRAGAGLDSAGEPRRARDGLPATARVGLDRLAGRP